MPAKPLKETPADSSRGSRYPVRSADELRQIEDAYKLNEISIDEICERFGLRGAGEFNSLRARHKWKGRTQGSKPASYMRRRHAKQGRAVYRGAAEHAADQRVDVERRERERYPGLVDDANLLRKRGYVVNRVDEPVYLVGNALCTGGELHAKAERERRLMAPPPAPVAVAESPTRAAGRSAAGRYFSDDARNKMSEGQRQRHRRQRERAERGP